jgi:valyl-tRNA synthetase
LELIRNLLKQQRSTEKQETIFVMNHIFKQILILLHPFIPFVSEQIYQNLYKDKKSILLEVYPDKLRNSFSSGDSKNMNIVTDIYKFAKSLRIKHNLKLIHPISINLITKNKIQKHDMNEFLQVCNVVIKKIVNKKTKKEALIYSTPNCLIEYFEDFASQQTQIDKLDAQLQYLNKEIERSKNILANKNFIEKAPVEKVNEEKRKYENYLKQHKEILETINKR